MSTNSLAAVKALRSFADKKIIPTQTGLLSWKEYANRPGRVDEESVIQPVVFPAFAKEILGWDLTVNLAAESNSDEGAPDFTPADAVTHPFVFETKGTNAGLALLGHDAQVLKYLRIGYPRIQKVVLTNMLSARIFDRDEHGALRERYTVHFKGLLSGNLAGVGNSVEAERLYEFVQEFSHRVLTREQKLERVRQAPPWNLEIANTSSAWIVTRVDGIVQLLKSEILREIQDGILGDRSVVLEDESGPILTELQGLASRIGIEESGSLSIADFTGATPSSDLGKALAQYAAHVAFFTTAKLLLVRVWEDLRMLEPMLYNGGFKKQMERFENVIGDVINHAFSKAKERYRPLFDQRNAYSWYVPNDDHYADIVYELANTYFGGIESDVLGQVYERMLERIDRKLLGVYYTPRDIIKLIWDLVDLDSLSDQAEAIERTPRILDIATGSGGFLVEAATRLRSRLAEQTASGADIDKRKWLADVSDGLNGVEYQRFAAYLAELNLIVQLGHVLASSPGLAIPSIGIISADTLSLHEPAAVFENELEPALDPLLNNGNTAARKDRIQSAEASNFLMDAAIGNPPYIGEKLASPILNATRREYPYWNNFVGPHMDYLYWFLILGVSKLREEGRFGFITTEYWMRADGAGPLRKYLGEKTTIERIILFRDFRLFPDAKGQHSLIVIGRRTSEPKRSKPKVSIYRGSGDVGAARTAILDAIRDGRSAAKVDTFTASLSPNILLGSSWAEVLLTSNERSRRQKLLSGTQICLTVSKGVETTLNALTGANEQFLTGAALTAVGGPGAKHGIQLLTSSEVLDLGTLNSVEQAVLRKWVNTKDVYPYAVVLPDEPDSIIYLAKPTQPAASTADPVSGVPFPAGMPRIQSHLMHFKTLLEDNTTDRKERRPWWTLHRARETVIGNASADEHGWAPFCLTTRWGGGGKLVVGLAPGGSAPASGLHVLRPEGDLVPPAYLAALYNSDLYQEIALSLPPGQLRQADLERIGLPLLQADAVESVSKSVYELARLVTTLVRQESLRFPRVLETLRSDVTLSADLKSSWLSETGASSLWGKLQEATWATTEAKRAAGTPLGDVSFSDDLLGQVVTIHVRNEPQKTAAEIHLAGHVTVAASEALAAAIRGLAFLGGKVRDLGELYVPIDPEVLSQLKAEDDSRLDALLEQYKTERTKIEEALGQHVR